MSIPGLPLPLESLRFKGSRDYLQGADILSAAFYALSGTQPVNEIRDIDIVFHNLARAGLTLQDDYPHENGPKARIAFRTGDARHKVFLVEDGRPVLDRRPYPEDKIVAATTIDVDSASATSSASLPFTNIERWIAMLKALHHTVYPGARGKWLFARAKLDSYQDAYPRKTEHQLRIESDFNGRLTRSVLRVENYKIGDIFFALS